MRIVLDSDRCEVAGECVYNHPSYFGWSDGDLPVVLRAEIDTADDQRHAEQAIAGCPSGAISIGD